ncbi:hypothetical protein PTE30175_01814 [Pandoraea terrae]|uniref:DUF1329 domain-containing protein n=1 Tax=Pandoraea terrae TaxID=1537710 RepID=A0A5E4U7W5_9BURK|nr:DUF1329 domain-containing protein [Pandoraea terrae]VVD96156.1 hypothetical protein PTE30175_01814 [Pandoraea terrae]
MKTLNTLALAVLAIAMAGTGSVSAAVSPEEAAKLKTELTPLGGEKAGNKEGTIPAWDGGYTKVPAGYKSGQPRPDPFANEKPLLTITAANMAQYSDKLDEGQKYLLKKYADYKINVYPTHRTAAAPQWVYDETFKNATRAKLDGYAVKGAYGGPPFPIPKSGVEVMWNHALRVAPGSENWYFRSYVVDSNGSASIGTGGNNEIQRPYYIKGESPESVEKGFYFAALQSVTEPSVRAGELVIFEDKLDDTRASWQYLVGQRRVRRAPNLCCDTPNFVNSGVDFFDEPFVFFGPMDRYDWKIVGKREMYIPYNMNGFFLKSDKEVTGKHFANPEYVRWELHRVWEIEGTVRAGQRDVRARRKIYVDEDSWVAVLGDTFDGQGTLWHTTIAFPTLMYELPALYMQNMETLDLLKGSYTLTIHNDQKLHHEIVKPFPVSLYTPEGMLNKGVR